MRKFVKNILTVSNSQLMRYEHFGCHDESFISAFSMPLCYILITSIKLVTIKLDKFIHKIMRKLKIV